MALKQKVSIIKGLSYQGGLPMLSWLLHRISGLGILLFVGMHVTASFFVHVVGTDSNLPNEWNIIYESWAFQLFIYFCVIFHALNGLRVIILDLWPKALQYQREMTWLEWAIFIPLYGMGVFFILRNAFAGG
jgi:succinate dehydrogenase / fumarate reductase, cytochrome b subunit